MESQRDLAGDEIDRGLSACVTELQPVLDLAGEEGHVEHGTAPLLLLHYVTGPSSRPYQLRRTALGLSGNSHLVETARAFHSKQCAAEDAVHREAFRKYIRCIDRNNTILDVAIRAFPYSGQHEWGIGTIVSAPEEDEIDLRTQTELQPGAYPLFRWTLGRAAANTLCPPALTDALFRHLYELGANGSEDLPTRNDERRELQEALLLARADCFGRWLARRASAPGRRRHKMRLTEWYTSRNMKETLLKRECLERSGTWRKIGALQSALLYFAANMRDPLLGENSCTVVVVPDRHSGNENVRTHAVAVFSPAINIGGSRTTVRCLKRLLESTRYIEHGRYESYTQNEEELLEELELGGKPGIVLKRLLDKWVGAPPQYAMQVRLNAFWIMSIAMKLATAKHEGKRLRFCFICGEGSDLADDGNIDVRMLAKGADALRLPQPNLSKLEVRSRAAADLLEQEHFPWFEDGRHALLWDIGVAFGDTPRELVSLKSSNWWQVVKSRFDETTAVMFPSCLLCYADSERGIAGLITAERSASKHRVALREIARLRNGVWELLDADTRRRELRKHLSIALKGSSCKEVPSLVTEMAGIIVRIADNPDSGGTILLVDEVPNWTTMGEAWQLEQRTIGDVVAMIGHDGATVHVIPAGTWRHRLLLTPKIADRRMLGRLERGTSAEWPLKGKGSRRWSAAMMAFDPDVRAVIVMSHDGGIHLWYVKRDASKSGRSRAIMLELGPTGPIHDSPLDWTIP